MQRKATKIISKLNFLKVIRCQKAAILVKHLPFELLKEII